MNWSQNKVIKQMVVSSLLKECPVCKKQTNEEILTEKDYEYLGRKGTMYVHMCKECNREQKLKDLLDGEKR